MVNRLSTLLIILFSLFLVDCSKQNATKNKDGLAAKWEHHLSDYPKRWVAAEKPMYIRFSHPVVAADKVNKPAEGILEFSPDVHVNILFTADNEIRITPIDRLPNDTAIKVKIHGDKLQGIEKSLDPFLFEVHTIKQDFELKIHGLEAQDGLPNKMQFSGELSTTDTAEADAVRKILTVTLDGQPAELVWNQNTDKIHSSFSLQNIERKNTSGNLHVEWNGAAIGSTDKGARDIPVPGLSEFIVTGVEVIREPSLSVQVNFSNPIDPSQNMQGLVELENTYYPVKVENSQLKIYPTNIGTGPKKLVISADLRSRDRQRLVSAYQQSLVLVMEHPRVSFSGKDASILPPAEHLTVPFTAVNVDSVQVLAFKVYENNIGYYFQNNSQYNPAVAPTQSGRYLWRKVYRLPEIAHDDAKTFNLDLTELMAQHPDGLIRLELQIDRSNSIYACSQDRPKSSTRKMPANREYQHEERYIYDENDNYVLADEPEDEEQEKPDWYAQYYQSQGIVNYSDRNDPCKDAYYSDNYYYNDNKTKSARTFMLSNIGLLAKRGSDNLLHVVATNLTDAMPMSGAEVRVFNFQQQVIAKGTTDGQGMLEIKTDGVPFYLEATKDKQRGYLRLPKNEALPMNQFDVGGEHIKSGLKGFIYGERDVWRPGDDIYLTFILQDKNERLPEKYPVTLDLFDPQGKKVFTQTQVEPVKKFYTFTAKTEEAAPTGNYRAVVHVGNRFFDKIVKVETVTPNRLKVELNFDNPLLAPETMPQTVHLFSQWLHGGTAKNLKADSEVRLLNKKTQFTGYDSFVFDDPSRKLEEGTANKVFDGNLNEEGKANFTLKLEPSDAPPGMLTAMFNTRVFEESGNFSMALRSFDFAPYDYWVGLLLPKADGYYNSLSYEKDHEIQFQTLNARGKIAPKRNLSLSVYEIGWRWWWDEGSDNIAEYMGNNSHTPVAQANLVSDANGKTHWTLTHEKFGWGRYLIRVCDTESNHCSGQAVYLGWSENNQRDPESATQLMLSTDKENYRVGDTAIVRLPKSVQGRVLMSLENGSQVLEKRWIDVSKNSNEISVPITSAMAPNTYVQMVLLMPHQKRETDAPLRLYGVVPLMVEDPQTHLQPQIEVAEKVRPETKFTVKVSEKDGHAMTYTLAMVDEGLLGLTGFTAPDPHTQFYKREALGVTTWDMFNNVVGAYGASLERILAIGGSDAAQDAEKKRRERRFPPIVKFLGAFTLDAGKSRTHEITLPPYMGAVRIMVIAGDNEKVPAYGKAEKSVKVTQPLVLYATLPRVLGPREEVNLPVNVFAGDETVKDVQITAETNEIFSLVESKAQLHFDKPGDDIAMLRLKVNDRIGKGRVKVVAKATLTNGSEETAAQEIFIESRPANPPTVVWQSKLLAPGEVWDVPVTAHGMLGTNNAQMEVSVLPPLNLEKRLNYLITYPHGCVEQTTSSVFPQLHLANLIQLSDAQKAEIDKNIAAGIQRLSGFQMASGGLSYWPGGDYVNEWGNSYAGHFLVEAKRAGYNVPSNFYDNWIKYQQDKARSQSDNNNYYGDEVSAYRLYTLALADKAELPAMNRLREKLLQPGGQNQIIARWMLGAAYLHLGLKDASKDLIGTLNEMIPDHAYSSYTYASDLRDESLALNTLVKAGQASSESAWKLAEKIATDLGGDNWYSTQSTSWGLLAMSEFVNKRGGSSAALKFSVKQKPADAWKSENIKQTFYKQTLNDPHIQVRNDDSTGNVRVLVSNRGIPASMDEAASSSGFKIETRFLTLDNKPLDVQKLAQGTDFVAEVTVTSDFSPAQVYKMEDIALTMIMPSGWQIRNERLEGVSLPKGIDYMDIRDDRVLSYFSLWRDYYWYYRYHDRSQNSVTIRTTLNASYAGKFYLPSWQVVAMYDEKIQARTQGYWVEVMKK